jgi:hypothetical protein
MTKFKKAAKKTKKYDLSRSTLADRLDQLTSELRDLEPLNTSPNEVADALSSIVDELEALAVEVLDEQY